MFVDYYALLEVNIHSSSAEIKAGFKKQAMKWHPDKNPGMDTTEMMQKLNEAKLILLDPEAKERYDKEYLRFKQFREEFRSNQNQSNNQRSENTQNKTKNEENNTESKYDANFEYHKYDILDETLKKWMHNAKKQAVHLAQQTIEDLRGMSLESGKAIGEAMLGGVVRYLLFGLVLIVIMRACSA